MVEVRINIEGDIDRDILNNLNLASLYDLMVLIDRLDIYRWSVDVVEESNSG